MKNIKPRGEFLREEWSDKEIEHTLPKDSLKKSLDKLRDVANTPESEYDEGMITVKKAREIAFDAYRQGVSDAKSYNVVDVLGRFDKWWDSQHLNENMIPRPCPKTKCLECGEEVCDSINYKIGHLYNKHNCKPSVNDYKAKAMLKRYFI